MVFKNNFSFNDRLSKSNELIMKYPDRIPIICEQSATSTDTYLLLDKNKYLVPHNFTLGQFLCIIRKRLKLSPEKTIFLFIEENFYSSNQLLSNIYDTNKDKDGFLYITYAFENTFGNNV